MTTNGLAEAFWRQAALNAVSPAVAALLGGLVVSILVQRAQGRRERQKLRSSLSFDMLKAAYGFYFPLIEVIRKEHYAAPLRATPRRILILPRRGKKPAPLDPGDLPQQYEDFRIAARVVEEQLRVNFPDAEVRWLWHGVVDMLSARYFRLVHIPERFSDMAAVHGQHPFDPEIPPEIQKLFMTLADYQDTETVDQELLRRFESMLNEAIRVVLRLEIDPPSGAAILRPGRGPRLAVPAVAPDPRLTHE
jgi:hypothetical protein